MPQSAAINPAARQGTPAATPANVAPNALPQGQGLPRANALPVPGAKGAPSVPPPAVSGTTPATNPNARLAPSAAAPAAVNPESRGRQDAGLPRPPGAQGTPAQTGSIGHGLRERQAPPALSPGGAASPGGRSSSPAVSARPSAPPPQVRPQIRQERASLPPPRAAAPPPHMAPPPPRAAAPIARPAHRPPWHGRRPRRRWRGQPHRRRWRERRPHRPRQERPPRHRARPLRHREGSGARRTCRIADETRSFGPARDRNSHDQAGRLDATGKSSAGKYPKIQPYFLASGEIPAI